ncbi:ATP-dependent RNA helicase DDX51 [Strongylocentrotus purpuratus]|uniref:ATP-dependent RNA helicase n=1 Tax=Strongylocentrotus purpuratus TaxID=7668 RepID=A0A7M7T2P4_STRPU|nr:ATP-dependent RNA helicase DDX51 [Strongylocentrotus purpuratus]
MLSDHIMSLFTVNRYLGESPVESGASPGQSILDKINAKAKAREEQRKQTPLKLKESSPAQESKVKHATPRRTAKDESPSSQTPGTDSVKRKKKKKKLVVQQESSDAVGHGDDGGDTLLPQVGEMIKEDEKRDEDVTVAVRDAVMLTAKERKQRVIDQGLVPKDSVVTIKKKKGKRKNEEGKVKEGEDRSEISEMSKKTRLEMKDGESLDLSPSGTKRIKEKLKKNVGKKDRTDKNQTTKDEELNMVSKDESRKEEEEEEQMEVDKEEEEEDGGTVEEEKVESEDDKEPHNFVILGDFERKHKKKKVQEALPDWLARPSVIQQSLTNDLQPVNSIKGLDERLVTALAYMGVEKFFPVQQHVIPVLLESLRDGIHTGHAGYRPRDLCISAPTGSGKTLAYAIPIIQALMNRVVCRVRALVVLPTRDLATQVYKIISALCKATPLKPVLIGGTKKFAQEQSLLVREIDGELHSLADIVVATPGRLVDNISQTAGFNLQHLRFLVIDEADRLMEHISQDWIAQVEKSAYTPLYDNGTTLPTFTSNRQRPGPLTINRSSSFQLPLQKLLFSATLSQNPEKLTQLRLFQPRLITTATSSRAPPISAWHLDGEKEGVKEEGKEKDEGRTDFVGKYTTPVGLSEYFVQCTAGEKPLVLQHFLLNLYFKQVLCFTNSVQTTHRLYLLLKLMGDVEVSEFSSNLSQSERQNILKQFKAGKIQILVCSDAMARGMDIENVRCVISYDLPPHLKTYIHRVGRTARAGRGGTAFSFIRKKEVNDFKHMLKNAGKDGIQRHTVSSNHLEALAPAYTEALTKLSSMLREQKAHQY